MGMGHCKKLACTVGRAKHSMQGRLALRACKGDSRSERARETRAQSVQGRLALRACKGDSRSERARETRAQSVQGRLTLRASFFDLPAQSKSKLLFNLPSMLFCRRPSRLCILLSMLLRTLLSKLCRRPPAAKLPLLPALRNSLSCTHRRTRGVSQAAT